MSSQDLVKFLTQELVKYMETPRHQRKQRTKETWMMRWFGMIPLSVKMMIHRKRRIN